MLLHADKAVYVWQSLAKWEGSTAILHPEATLFPMPLSADGKHLSVITRHRAGWRRDPRAPAPATTAAASAQTMHRLCAAKVETILTACCLFLPLDAVGVQDAQFTACQALVVTCMCWRPAGGARLIVFC